MAAHYYPITRDEIHESLSGLGFVPLSLKGVAELVCAKIVRVGGQSQDFIEVADDFGLPTDEHQELADQLRSLRIPVDQVIASVRGIERVEE